MRPRFATFLLLAILLAAFSALAAGCGTEEETEVNEGEPLELGEITYDLQITRFLNPDSPDDSAYLSAAPPLAEGQQYLGVFLRVTNEGEEPNVVPQPLKIVDTRGTIYYQEEVDNPFALVPGTPLAPDESVPGPETAAANGPIEGSLVLFALDEGATENRPLQLLVPGADGVGKIELDL